jgi:ABC-type antimicrobial peptide transport system permease subunit
MNTLNPYAASNTEIAHVAQAAPAGLKPWRALKIFLGCGGGGAFLGGLLGALIGGLLPDYYHAVFRNPGLSALEVGIGLGLTQGLGAGLVVGAIIVLATAISIRRRS